MNVEAQLLKTNKHFTLKDKNFILSLLAIDGVGRRTVKKIIYSLIKHELDFQEFWVNKNSIWQKSHISNKTIKRIINQKKEHNNYSIYKNIINKNIRVLSFWEKEYPLLLKQCDDFPLLLFAMGNIESLNNDSIGVVGTRRITSYGRLATKKIVEDLVLEGFNIISGFMYGVDLCAHLETINNDGTTIAILGFGFDHMYPKSHQKYFNKVIESGGCFITEYLPDVGPKPGNFPTRNRIVAGMSRGVVVVEAAKKSGSHITAECAINEGREVYAVPGPINNPFSEGTKWLLNEGATLITSGNDVVAELRNCSKIPKSTEGLSKVQKLIVKELASNSHTLESLTDSLVKNKKTELSTSTILKEFTLLEINDFVRVEDNNLILKL